LKNIKIRLKFSNEILILLRGFLLNKALGIIEIPRAYGASEGIRTPGQLVRSQLLYPTELLTQINIIILA
jgi:hypothetical protein